jgi:hypothetical protein
VSPPNTGARYEIAIDGMVRSHRDRLDIALEVTVHLKTKQPHAEITVRPVAG